MYAVKPPTRITAIAVSKAKSRIRLSAAIQIEETSIQARPVSYSSFVENPSLSESQISLSGR